VWQLARDLARRFAIMKTSHLASRGFLLVAFLAHISVAGLAHAESEKITGPTVQGNLAIYLIRGSDRPNAKTYLTLQEALAQKKAVVRETGNVNELTIENTSQDADIYIQAGDIVKGGQQDRTLGNDFVLEPKAKLPISAFCVEHGRWSKRGKESVQQFESCNDQVASKDLKMAVKSRKAQGEVWKNVAESQAKLSGNVGAPVAAPESASSLQLSLENDRVKASTDSYIAALGKAIDDAPDAIGFAFAINGKINSVDAYSSHELFKKMWPKLLKAAAVEAVAELQKGKNFEAPTTAQVEATISAAQTGQSSEEKPSKRIKEITRDNKDSVLFETKDQDVAVHDNVLVK
jgi:hypothetical protein